MLQQSRVDVLPTFCNSETQSNFAITGSALPNNEGEQTNWDPSYAGRIVHGVLSLAGRNQIAFHYEDKEAGTYGVDIFDHNSKNAT